MSNLTTRIITAIFGLAIFIFMLFYNYSTFAILFMTLNLLCLHEFFNIIQKHHHTKTNNTNQKRSRLLYNLIGTLIYLSTLLGLFSSPLFYLIIPISILFFVLDAYNKPTKIPIWKLIIGFIYIIWPFLIFTLLAFYNDAQIFKPLLVLCFFMLIWSNDVSAYFIGKKFGKTPLAKSISPKKTVEGFLGGFVGSILVALLCSFILPEIGWHFLAIALIVGFTGPLGDLFESALKRKAAIKDSGKILPGHGGALDRFDAALMAVPFVFLYLVLVI